MKINTEFKPLSMLITAILHTRTLPKKDSKNIYISPIIATVKFWKQVFYIKLLNMKNGIEDVS